MNDSGYTGKILIYIFVGIILSIGSLVFVYKFNQYITKEDKEEDKQVVKEKDINNNDIELGLMDLEYDNNNIIYSPLSIRYALSMVRDGADGNTLDEINNLLGSSKLNKYDNVENKLSLSNALYVQNGYPINEEYINSIRNNYNAEVLSDEVLSNDRINGWIEENSLGLLRNVIENDISGDRLLLVNTLAIDVNFLHPFYEEDATGSMLFNDKSVDSIRGTFEKNSLNYFEEDNLTGVSLDLENNLEYIMLMPKDINSYIKSLDYKNLNNDINKLKLNNEVIDLAMPAYDFEYSSKLKDDLISLGCKDMFDPGSANFSKMNSDLYIDDALHKANIKVSYKGIKAAAVTAFEFKDSAIMQENKTIDINKSFVFVIREKDNHDVWFIGTVVDLGE